MIDTSTYKGNFGEIVNQVMGSTAGYGEYLRGYEQAKDKMGFNSGYWAASNKAEFIKQFLKDEENGIV